MLPFFWPEDAFPTLRAGLSFRGVDCFCFSQTNNPPVLCPSMDFYTFRGALFRQRAVRGCNRLPREAAGVQGQVGWGSGLLGGVSAQNRGLGLDGH